MLVLNIVLHKKLADILHQYHGVQVPANIQQQEFISFFRYLKKNNLSPQPLFTGSTDENLKTHFSLNVTEEQAKNIQSGLLKITGVDGAWAKPSDELPA